MSWMDQSSTRSVKRGTPGFVRRRHSRFAGPSMQSDRRLNLSRTPQQRGPDAPVQVQRFAGHPLRLLPWFLDEHVPATLDGQNRIWGKSWNRRDKELRQPRHRRPMVANGRPQPRSRHAASAADFLGSTTATSCAFDEAATLRACKAPHRPAPITAIRVFI